MTQESEQLEAQSRAAIKAWCDDPSLEIESTPIDAPEAWGLKLYSRNAFDMDRYHYRIAKPKKFYRVGEDIQGCLITVNSEFQENCRQSQVWFKRWLDERKYYD
jgi:hypothetical protein